ncbi:MAG: hypothetical protein J5806_00335, partial [Lentisphaeria bacterium]|nr:hypothetical protein [Lentisphaeria bacterium]
AASFPTGDDMGICPFADCRHELSAPETFARGKNLDTDRDGIPDEDEKKMGLNPNEAQDGREDADLDGFTNYEEYICKTDYKDPKSRPPYHEKMSVREVIQAMLPFKLKNVTYNGAKTKENAKLQIERKHPRPRLVDLKVGMEFVCYDMKYVIVDVIPKYVKSFNRGLGKEEEKDATEIIVSPVKNPNERILLPIRKDVPDPRLKTALEIINFKAATYGLKPSYLLGESFLLQFSSKTYPDEYTVVDIDPKKKTVTLRFKKDGKSYVIGETTMLDKKIQDIAKKQRAARRAAGRNSERE